MARNCEADVSAIRSFEESHGMLENYTDNYKCCASSKTSDAVRVKLKMLFHFALIFDRLHYDSLNTLILKQWELLVWELFSCSLSRWVRRIKLNLTRFWAQIISVAFLCPHKDTKLWPFNEYSRQKLEIGYLLPYSCRNEVVSTVTL